MGRKQVPRRPPAGVGGKQREASQRQRRVGEALRHALSQILRDGRCRDPALREASITVSEVRLSPDLRQAGVYVMPLAGAKAGEIMAALERSAPFLRGQVAGELSLRYAPALAFVLDASFEQAERISTLLARPEVERDIRTQPTEGENDQHAD